MHCGSRQLKPSNEERDTHGVVDDNTESES